jgi:polysaccharide biosynthesis/export protein
MQERRYLILQRLHLACGMCGLMLLPFVVSANSCAQQQAVPPVGASSTLSGPSSSHAVTHGASPGITAVPEDFSKLTLSSGFLLTMTVYDMPEISGELRVDDSGNVDVPMSGELHVAGMTLPQAKVAIQQKLVDAQILKNPKINLDVVQYAGENVTVTGEVGSPGRIQLLVPHSLSDVLGMVGGETQLAGSTIEVRRTVDGVLQTQTVKYARSTGDTDEIRAFMIKPGDTITIPRAGIVYVMGAVNRPGGYVMQEDGTLNVSQALSMALGTAMNAQVDSIRVVRKDSAGKLTEIHIPYSAISKGKAQPLTLQAQDLVYVPVSKIKTVFTQGLGIMSSTASALIYTSF